MDAVGKDTNKWKWARLKMGKKDNFWRKLYEMSPWLDYLRDTFESFSICLLKSSVDVLVYVTYFYLAYPALEIMFISE